MKKNTWFNLFMHNTTIDKNHLRCWTSYRAKKKKIFLKVFGQVLIKYSYVCVSEVRNTSFFENSYLLNGWPNSVLLFGIYGPLSLDLWNYSVSTEFKDQTFSENSTFFCASGVPHYSKFKILKYFELPKVLTEYI